MILAFHRTFFILAILLFAIEVLIALAFRDTFIRPYIGDVLVVVLIYCVIRSFVIISVHTAALFVLAFAISIETLQYFDFVQRMGLARYDFARVVLGSTFSWWDMGCYVVGMLGVLIIEAYHARTVA